MPELGFYEWQLALLISLLLVGLVGDRYLSRSTSSKNDRVERDGSHGDISLESWKAFRSLTWKYLVVYGTVMGADWLQGPYLYTLYREEYDFPERLVALFFVTGFVSAGVAAPIVGVLADQYGRRKLCLSFCILYSTACLLITVPKFPALLLGRVLGGISTSILFSCFEAWAISSSTSLLLPPQQLSTILGRATLLNGFMAALAGVASNKLVERTKSCTSPFLASAMVLCVGWLAIRGLWNENYGRRGDAGSETGGDTVDLLQLGRMWQACRIVRSDMKLIVLGLVQTCFEGSMYLFVFLWVPTLQEVTPSDNSVSLPLGYIFSSFMVSMMLGSLVYTVATSTFESGSTKKRKRSRSPSDVTASAAPSQSSASKAINSSLALHTTLSSLVCLVGAICLSCSVLSHDPHIRFYLFCLFEACVGMYYPVQGMLRGTLVSNEHRATVSSIFRVPLNVFVVISLLTGVSSARHVVLWASGLMLAFSSLLMKLVVQR
ncbi:hypothetical protein BDQ17DRAFT_1387989 [Cyathus striatus]|nr:hypothetical protein BDQ17DRAFT_1387989 [Cyathus striatus]